MKHPGTSRAVLAALLAAIAAVLAWRTSPFAANVDDQVRLYFGAYAGTVELRGGPRAEALRAELRAATARFSDPYLASRFVAAQTPYSPLTIASVAIAETVRPLAAPDRVLPWVLGEQTVLWAAMFALAWWARRPLPVCSFAWLLAAGLPLAWLHAHTHPFAPVPRAYACLFTALALALVATRGFGRWPTACLVLAAACHPLNQAVNLAVVLPTAVVLAGSPAAPALDRRALLRFGGVALLGVAAMLLVVSAANPRGSLALGTILAEQSAMDPAASWPVAKPLVQRLAIALGLPLAALVYRYCGPGRAALVALLVVATLVASGTLAPRGEYPTEYLSRVGGGWAAVLFGLCLRADLLPAFARLRGTARVAVIAALVALALPAAFPELTRSPNTIHRPLGGWPGGISLSPVEAECTRLLRWSGEWPARRPRPRTPGSR
jgi:hypothetical protein